MEFQVGFGRVCITPTEPVPLGGYGNTSRRISQTKDSDLFCTCIAFTDANGQSALVMSCDLLLTAKTWSVPGRKAASEATGVPVERILISSTHTHEAPDHGNAAFESILRHNQSMIAWIAEAAKLAMEDRKPAEMYLGSTRLERVSYVRHYILADGTYAGDNFGDFNSASIINSTTEADRNMQIVKFVRRGGKDVILVNWQTHPHRSGGATKFVISSDIVGGMRTAMERDTDCLFCYFSGASGNINTRSRNHALNLVGDHVVCGEYMAKQAISAINDLQSANVGRIRGREQTYSCKTDHTKDHLAQIGLQLRQEWERTGDMAACIEAGKPYGIHSPYHALAIVNKSKIPPNRDFEISVISVGDLAFVAAPYEMFDTNGTQIKQGSPYASTFICTCANEYVGYIPSAYGYSHGCYEADCTPLAPGSGELLAMEYISMLCQTKQGS